MLIKSKVQQIIYYLAIATGHPMGGMQTDQLGTVKVVAQR